ncbi:interleukin-2 receptor subunit beta-like [Acipenser ruthenus]|uniref:interleukin-2 receptor subunit beta-like n=1 Tax=Acipenser ruthenus TaxID=7906 RepID=UPI002741B153|nr:interleukin-2 receptor subunit beta-like [Acipenser ruthenus]XP_058875396.1 interleukin-2 receptor subunit beta-like [Acipenser ruthenus]
MAGFNLLVLSISFCVFQAAAQSHQEGGSLKCVSDYKSTLSCAWNTTGKLRESSCRLHFTWTVNRLQKKIQRYETCELQDSPSDPRMQSCSVIAGGNQERQMFTTVTVITSRVKCGNCSQDAANITFKPVENVKMHPPFAPSIVDSTNITWTLNHSLISVHLQQREFQIRFKRKEKSWEDARVISELQGQEWTRLNEKLLDRDAVYETQVRVKSREHAGEWSEWSPVTEWRSEVGNMAAGVFRKPDSPLQTELLFVMICVPALAVFLITIYSRKWIHRVSCLNIPDPSKYFAPLNSQHGGNFQKWLSPMFSPESYTGDESNTKISLVEVFEVKGSFEKECPGSGCREWGKNCDSSSSSGGFSNMGYFYSKYPGSLEIDSCPVYFSYEPADRNSDTSVAESYERLENLEQDPGKNWENQESLDPDSGFGLESGSSEESPDLNGLPHAVSTPLPFPSTLPASWFLPHGQFPFPAIDFTALAAGSSGPPGGALFNASPLKIPPTVVDYMSVKDLQNLNKPI